MSREGFGPPLLAVAAIGPLRGARYRIDRSSDHESHPLQRNRTRQNNRVGRRHRAANESSTQCAQQVTLA